MHFLININIPVVQINYMIQLDSELIILQNILNFATQVKKKKRIKSNMNLLYLLLPV